MCDHLQPPTHKTPRYGSRLAHGTAHTRDHQTWSRRDFLTGLGLTAGGSFMLGGLPVRTFGQTSLLSQLQQAETDRILVLVQLCGGNDGLNTLVQIENDRYYQVRPRLAIPKHVALPLTDTLGFHPALQTLSPLYGDGQMAIVQSVGYPSADLSHFRSTDIWVSASDADVYWNTGWTGRYLEEAVPNFEEEPSAFPLAVQLGGLSSMLFQGTQRNMGMSLTNPEVFERLAREGTLYDTSNVPATAFGGEIAFMRTTANDAFRYAQAIQTAAELGRNEVSYPDMYENYLAHNLSIVARLIKGNLGSRVYHVSIGGFDTHAEQGGTNGNHATLLRHLAEAVSTFLLDLGSEADRVLMMTFSEFGRRVEQNGSEGTDHGTAAPLFFFGPGVNGGLFGTAPLLTDLDINGNMKYSIDFRAAYATVLQHWFGFSGATSEAVLGHTFDPLNIISNPAEPTAVEEAEVQGPFTLHANYPNPFNPSTTLSFTLAQTALVRLRVYDVRGRLVKTLVDGMQPGGTHTVTFEAQRLPSGPYFYRLESPEGTQTQKMMLVR